MGQVAFMHAAALDFRTMFVAVIFELLGAHPHMYSCMAAFSRRSVARLSLPCTLGLHAGAQTEPTALL